MPSVHRGALLALGIVSAGLILWRVRAWTEELGSLRETRVASAAAVETSPTRNKQPLAVATTPESAEVETGAPAPQSAKLDDVAPHIGLVDSKDSGAEDVHVEGSFEREQVVLTLKFVNSAEEPVEGVKVFNRHGPVARANAEGRPALADVITGKSGEDGRFVLEGLFSGRWQVGARGIAWGRALEGTLQVDLPFASTDAPTEPLLLRLSDSARLPALPVRVHLFDAGTGHPLPEARGSILKDLVPRSGCSARVSEGGSFGELEFGQPEPKFELQDGWIADSFREGFYLVRFGYRDYEPSVASFEVAMIPLEIEIPMVPLYCD